MGLFRKLFTFGIWGFALVSLLHYWISNKAYLIDEGKVHRIAKRYAGKDVEQSFMKIHQDLLKLYPGYILPRKDLHWVFINSGGFMGSFCLLHASLTEYILFFGTALDTSGHSGRYYANVTDTWLSGQFRQWPEGSLHAITYKPGDTVKHEWGEATSVYFAEGTWAFETGRGFIPSTLFFALADTVFSTTDFVTMGKTFIVYGKALFLVLQTNIALLLQ